MKKIFGWLSLLLLLLNGCSPIGPSTITRDRFDYVASISDSWKRQMLLNLLKVRYSDAPVFMDVSSVINSYEMVGEVNLRGAAEEIGRNDLLGASIGATGRYADRPTITYQPLSGDKFARSLMIPIPVPSILFLIQSGYPADMVMRVSLNSINGLDNSYGGPGNFQNGDPKFQELITAIRESQRSGGMGMRMKTSSDRQAVVMFLRPATDATIAGPVLKIRELLGLNANSREFQVIYGSYPENDGEIAMLSRSMLQVLVDFASYIDVPANEIAEGRVYSPQRDAEQKELFPPLLAVHSGSSAPSDAYVSVRYRNHWYWIEDRDARSKQLFNFMLIMFSLTETGSTQAAPIVTVPTR